MGYAYGTSTAGSQTTAQMKSASTVLGLNQGKYIGDSAGTTSTTWTVDGANANNGYPVFGNYYGDSWQSIGKAVSEKKLTGANFYPSGSGTKASPYQIYTPEALAFFAYQVNSVNASACANLMANVSLAGSGYGGTSSAPLKWDPIGNADAHAYTGTFNGNGKTVSSLYVYDTSEAYFKGLFGIVGTASTTTDTVVTNLSVSGSVAGWDYVGLAFGAIRASARIDHVTTSGTVTGRRSDAGAYTGGIVGRIDGVLEDSVNRAAVSSPLSASQDVRTGGVTGHMEGNGTVRRCANYGAVSSNQHAGGIAGYMKVLNGTPKIEDCYNVGAIMGSVAGGIAGELWGGSVTGSYSYGAMSTSKGTNATRGGVVGKAISGSVSNCYYDSTVAGTLYVGGVVGTGSSVIPSSSAAKTTTQMRDYDFAYLLNGSRGIGDTNNTKSTMWTTDYYYTSNIPWSSATTRTNNGYPVFGTLLDKSWGGVGSKQTLSSLKSSNAITGTGTSGDPLVLNTPEALAWYAYAVNYGVTVTGSTTARYAPAKLGANIDLTGTAYYGTSSAPLAWVPIGSRQGYELRASFDGDGKAVTNMRIDAPNGYYKGFVGKAQGGTIKNLSVSGSVVGYDGVALVVGYADALKVQGCSAAGSVKAIDGGGYNEDINAWTGGVVGSAQTTSIFRCANKGKVSARVRCGGVVGSYLWGADPLTDCYNAGSVTLSNPHYETEIGGVAGWLSDSEAENCYNYGPLTVPSGSTAAGIVAMVTDKVVLKNCWYDPSASKATALYGSLEEGAAVEAPTSGSKTTAEMTAWTFAKLLNGGSFVGDSAGTTSTVWNVDKAHANNGYPVFGNLEKAASWGDVGSWQQESVLKASKVTVSGSSTYALSGSGTSASPYLLATPEALAWFAYQVNNTSGFASKHARLAADIDLAGTDYGYTAGGTYAGCLPWTPLGTTSAPYTGTFNGWNKGLTNLYVTGSGSIGFFSRIGNGSVVENLRLKTGAVAGTDAYQGALVGTAASAAAVATLLNCHNDGVSVTVPGTTMGAGGLLGQVSTSGVKILIEKCSNSASVKAGAAAAGLMGYVGGAELTVNSCFNRGAITCTGESYAAQPAAGLTVGGSAANVKVSNSYNAGTLSWNSGAGQKGYAVSSAGTLSNCWYANDVAGASAVAALSGASGAASADLKAWGGSYQLNGGDGLKQLSTLLAWRQAKSTSENGGFPVPCALNPSTNAAVESMGAASSWSDVGRWVDAFAAAKKPSGAGTSSSHYQIGTPEALAWWAYVVTGKNNVANAAGTAYGATYADQTAALNLSGLAYNGKTAQGTGVGYANCLPWSPIGVYSAAPFKGVFDGKSNAIQNLYAVGGTYKGLFGYAAGSSAVKNAYVYSGRVDADSSSLVVGVIGGSAAVSGCQTGASASVAAKMCGAGMVGTWTSCTAVRIENCVNRAPVRLSGSTGSAYAGGIAPSVPSGMTIDNCSNAGAVALSSAAAASAQYAGGIAGYTTGGTVQRSSSTAAVSGGNAAGGIAGYAGTGAVRDCWASSSASAATYAGGVVGQTGTGANLVLNSYSYGTSTTVGSGSYKGGVAGYQGSTTAIANCYYSSTRNASAGKAVGNYSDTSTVKGMTDTAMKSPVFAFTLNAARSASGTYPTLAVWAWAAASNSGYPYIGTPARATLDWEAVAVTQTASALQSAGKLSGSGTQASPYVINSAEALAWWAYQVNTSSAQGTSHAQLGADIDLAGSSYGSFSAPASGGTDFSKCLPWSPAGKSTSYPFKGSFDGKGHTVKNLYVSGGTYQGLFGYANATAAAPASIANVKVLGAVAGATSTNAAGLVVGCGYYTAVTGCSALAGSSVAIPGSNTGTYVGGIAGHLYYAQSKASGCSSAATVSGAGRTGGIVGEAYDSPVEKSENTGFVTGVYAGGIVGLPYSGSCTIKACWNGGSVSGTSATSYVGGIGGYVNGSKIEDCYNKGAVSGASTGSYVGGVTGYLVGAPSINRCYSYGAINGTAAYKGGAVGYALGGSTVANVFYDKTAVTGATQAVGNVADVAAGSSQARGATTAELKSWGAAYHLNGGAGAVSRLAVWRQAGTASENGGYPVLCAAGQTMNAATSWNDLGWWIDAFAGAQKPGGSGAFGSAYEVSSPEQLAWLAYRVNAGDANQHAKMLRDIDLAGLDYGGTADKALEWNPIGNRDATPFTGEFAGAGFTVGNLRIDYTGTDPVMKTGLFGTVGASSGTAVATVSNLNVQGSVSGYDYVGMAFGAIRATASVDHIATAGTVEGRMTHSGAYAGGIAGRVDGLLEDGVNRASVSSPSSASQDVRTGGVAGHMEGNGIIRRCTNYGAVQSNQHGGGIAGYLANVGGTPKIEDCYNAGSVTGAIAGGIVAQVEGGIVSNCYSYGKVSDSKGTASTRGGIVGTRSSGTLQNCYYDSTVDASTTKASGSDGNIVTGSAQVKGVPTAVLKSWAAAYALNGGDGAKALSGLTAWRKASSSSENGGYPVFCASGERLGAAADWADVGLWADVFSTDHQASGTGVAGNALAVSDATQLAWVAYRANSGSNLTVPGGTATWGNAIVTLTADIDLSGTAFTGAAAGSLGSDSSKALPWVPFVRTGGTLDGGSHSVKYATAALLSDARGGCVVQDVDIDATCSRTTTRSQDAGLVLGGSSNATLLRCSNHANIASTYASSNAYIGGLAAFEGASGRIAFVDCYNAGAVGLSSTATNACAGGICGGNTAGTSSFENCYNAGTVTGGRTRGPIDAFNKTASYKNVYAQSDTCSTMPSGVTALAASELQTSITAFRLNAGRTGEDKAAGAAVYAPWGWDGVRNAKRPYLGAPVIVGLDTWEQIGQAQSESVLRATTVSGSLKALDGLGTAAKPLVVASPEALAWLAFQVNRNGAGSVAGGAKFGQAVVRLGADIDLTGSAYGEFSAPASTSGAADFSKCMPWTGIGAVAAFGGSFDGQGHTVKNLYCNAAAAEYDGLFGRVSGSSASSPASVSNVKVLGQVLAGKKGYYGLAVGYASSAKIQGCESLSGSSARSTFDGNSTYVGGVVGEAISSSTVSGCVNRAAVSGNDRAGGVAGQVQASSRIEGCSNDGAVSGMYSGGVAGLLYDGTRMERCSNTGPVSNSKPTAYVGGLVGWHNSAAIADCYNAGAVSHGGTAGYAGGLVGRFFTGGSAKGTLETSYSRGTLKAASLPATNRGGVTGYQETGLVSDCFYDTTAAPASDAARAVGENADVATGSSQVKGLTPAQLKSWGAAYELNGGAGLYSALKTWRMGGASENGGYPVLCAGSEAMGAASGWKDVGEWVDVFGGNGAKPASTTGTASIGTAEGLAWLAAAVDGGSAVNLNVSLTSNVSLIGANYGGTAAKPLNWMPIGAHADKRYYGDFAAGGRTVSYLRCDSTGTDWNYAAFIGVASGSVVTGLTVGLQSGTDSSVTAKNGYAGGLVGTTTADSAGTVSLADCANYATVTGDSTAGGLVGQAASSGSVAMTMERCENHGAVSGAARAGGLAGGTTGTLTLKDCFNRGTVSAVVAGASAASSSVGGLCGASESGKLTFSSSYNAAELVGRNSSSVLGEFAPMDEAGYTVDAASRYDQTVHDAKNAGALAPLGLGVSSSIMKNSGTAVALNAGRAPVASLVAQGKPTADAGPWVVKALKNDGYPYFSEILGLDVDSWEVIGIAMVERQLREDGVLSGSGTEGDPFLLGSASALAWWAVQVNYNPDDPTNSWPAGGEPAPTSTSYRSSHAKLAGDVSLDGTTESTGHSKANPLKWAGIGSKTDFQGAFDGGGFSVDCLNLGSSASQAGLFGTVGDGGQLSRVSVAGTYPMVTTGSDVGMVAYRLASGAKAADCSNAASVTAAARAAGVVAVLQAGASLERSSNTGAVEATAGDAAGLVAGFQGGAGSASVLDCSNAGAVKAAGGNAAGIAASTQSFAKVTSCYDVAFGAGGVTSSGGTAAPVWAGSSAPKTASTMYLLPSGAQPDAAQGAGLAADQFKLWGAAYQLNYGDGTRGDKVSQMAAWRMPTASEPYPVLQTAAESASKTAMVAATDWSDVGAWVDVFGGNGAKAAASPSGSGSGGSSASTCSAATAPRRPRRRRAAARAARPRRPTSSPAPRRWPGSPTWSATARSPRPRRAPSWAPTWRWAASSTRTPPPRRWTTRWRGSRWAARRTGSGEPSTAAGTPCRS